MGSYNRRGYLMIVDFGKLRNLLSPLLTALGLSSVATDGTLTGDGTTGSPLSVVGAGGITVVTTASGATAFSAGASDNIIRFDTSVNDQVFNLPSAATPREFKVKKIAEANTVTLDPSGAELIEGAATFDFVNNLEAFTIVSNGVSWDVF